MNRRDDQRGTSRPSSVALLAALWLAVIAAFAVTGGGVAGADLPVPSPAGPESPIPTTAESSEPSSAPTPDVDVLTLGEFQIAFAAAQRDGRQRTVIADVALDRTLAANHHGPQCLRAEGCPTVVGEIVGVPGVAVWASPDVAASLGAPGSTSVTELLALTFGNADVITLLGVVVPRDDGTVVWPADQVGLFPLDADALAQVIVVNGWLSWSGELPCPASPRPTPPPNSPFENCPWAWITPDPYQPWTGNTMTPPPGGTQVQWEAYQDFAGAPGGRGVGFQDPPVEGNWLLQLVEDPRPNADPKRGWQVVGRLTEGEGAASPSASPSGSPSAVADVHVLNLDELRSAMAAAQSKHAPRTVIAEVTLDRQASIDRAGPVCIRCPVDVGDVVGLEGTPVMAPPAVARDLAREHPFGRFTAHMALQIGVAPEITLLGLLDLRNGSSTVWPAIEGELADEETAPLAHVIAVHGWLVAEMSDIACPDPFQTPAPFPSVAKCPEAWITPERMPFDPANQLPVGVRVQGTAYSDYSGRPAKFASSEPVEGTWLLRLVEDPRPNADPKRGWLMVSRFLDAP